MDRLVTVNPKCASSNPSSYSVCTAHIVGPHRTRQAELGVVGQLYRLVFALERDYNGNWPKISVWAARTRLFKPARMVGGTK